MGDGFYKTPTHKRFQDYNSIWTLSVADIETKYRVIVGNSVSSERFAHFDHVVCGAGVTAISVSGYSQIINNNLCELM